MKEKDWQVILPAWEDYIGEAFGEFQDPATAGSPSNLCPFHQDADQDQDGTVIGGMRRVPKPQYEFDEDRKGLPIFPDMDDLSLETKKGMIRSFLTIHYSKPLPIPPARLSDIGRHREMLWKAEGSSPLERYLKGTVKIYLQHILTGRC